MSGIGQNGPPGLRFTRSSESENFERMWRDLPRKGSLPERHTFRPRFAKQFLRNLLLVQAPSPSDPTLRIRLVGDAISQQILGSIVGQDFLDFIPEPERKARVLDISRAMFTQPCGAWWVAPMHYERCYSRFWELTAFPLAGSRQTPAAILAHALPFDIAPSSRRTDQKAIHMGVASQVELIALDAVP